MLHVGEGSADITPAVGIELAGFHKAPGDERRVTGARMPARVRALLLAVGESRALIFSIDIAAVSKPFCASVQRATAEATGVPAENIFLAATHTHSMPTLAPLLQWGGVSPEFQAQVEAACLVAARAAKADLAEADLYLGRQRVAGGNFNRTAPDDRWLDTLLHVLYFQRADGKAPLAWYHFSAHPVCFGDTLSGPDWPGIVAEKIKGVDGVDPVLLQGHAGDVNPGDGTPWIGDVDETSNAVAMALHHASNHSEMVAVDTLRVTRSEVALPYDMPLFEAWRKEYAENKDACVDGVWVDPGFAAAWADRAAQWDMAQTAYAAPVGALRLGNVALAFHPAELYSYYGLHVRAKSPFPATLLTGYAGDIAGYLTDPKAYTAQEYAAVVVPKIFVVPPYRPEAADALAAGLLAALARLA